MMIITKKAIDRRTILRGVGAAMALPLLDSMVPALTALGRTAVKPVRRFGAVYVPNGIVMKNWTPLGEGPAFEWTPTLQPLAPFRDRLVVLSGLNSTPPTALSLAAAGPHARASTRFLTDVLPKYAIGSEIEAGISVDQLAASQLGQQTQLASLELALESAESVGDCDLGYSCAYTNTISWRSATTPLPMEVNPRVAFERLCWRHADHGSDRSRRPHSQRAQHSRIDV